MTTAQGTSIPQAWLNWRWRRVNGSRVAHLVPARILSGSRAACWRPVTPDDVLEEPAGLLTDVPLCAACAKANR